MSNLPSGSYGLVGHCVRSVGRSTMLLEMETKNVIITLVSHPLMPYPFQHELEIDMEPD